MKNLMYLFVMMLISVFVVAACGNDTGNTENKGDKDDQENNDKVESAEKGETYEFSLSSMFPDDHPNTIAAKEFIAKVKERSNDRIDIKLYPANQLGDPTVVYQEIGKGTIEMSLMSAPSNFDERLGFLYLPYLVTDFDQLEDVYGMDSFVFKTTEEIHDKQNIKLLGFHGEGFGGVGTIKPIENATEMGADKGMMIRIPQMEVFKKFTEGLGFRTVSISFSDLYMALQTGQAEGWIGGQPASNYTNFKDVIKYYHQYNNFFEVQSLIINKDLFADLSEEDQEIITTASKELTTNSFDKAKEYDEEFRQKLKEYGIEVILFEDEEINKIAEETRQNIWPELRADFTDEIIDGLMENIK